MPRLSLINNMLGKGRHDAEALAIDLLLSHVSGENGRGDPRLYVRLQGFFVAGYRISGARMSLLAKSNESSAWNEWNSEPDDSTVRTLVSLFAAAGFPSRAPEVACVVDTGLAFNGLFLSLDVNGHRWEVDLSMQDSGFDGADAAALRTALRSLFALVAYDGFDDVVFGSPNARSA